MEVLPCVKVECAVAGSGRSGWAGRAAGRWRSYWGRCRAQRGVGGGETGSQGAGRGHGSHCCATEAGHGLRQLAGHLIERQIHAH